MLGRLRWGAMRVVMLGLLLVVALPTTAQDAIERTLTPGISVDGTLNDDALAQVFTYLGSADEEIKLTLISADGLALGVLVTDAVGEPVTQGTDPQGNGFLVLDNVALPTNGTYYITVFPLAVADLPTQGSFSISLALASGTAPADANVAEVTPEAAVTEEAVVEATAEVASAVVESDPQEPGQVATEDGLQFSLVWNATADFNLEVRDPVGGTVFFDSPTTESGGTFEGVNANGACETFTANAPTESISWAPGTIPAGTYEILVFYVQDCEANGAVPFTVEAAFNGEALTPIEGTMLPTQTFISSIVIAEDGTATVRDGGVEQERLPAAGADIVAGAQPIAFDEAVNGVVTNEQVFEAYAFDAAAGDVITASIEAVSGSLDTYLFLLDGNGVIVESNDDADASLNSQIGPLAIETAGTYTLVATRYGQAIGGTEGEYVLTLTADTTGEGGGGLPDLVLTQDVPDGLIEVALQWNSNADVQLLVRDPAGDAVFDDSPVIGSGGQLILNGNQNCTAGVPESYVIWPENQRLRPGTYEIDIWYQSDCGDTTPLEASLVVSIGGQVIISDRIPSQEIQPLLVDDHYITTFTINPDATVVRGPGGISGGSETIDYQAELGAAPALTANIPVTGTISDDNRFDVYTFTGAANEVVSVRMEATAGTLDTLLFLVSPTGVELASNDDIVPGENRNSLISEFQLPQDGQYVILATHYGTIYGGTNGVYTLTLTR